MEKKFFSSRLFILSFMITSCFITWNHSQTYAMDRETEEFGQEHLSNIRQPGQKDWMSQKDRLSKRNLENTKKTKELKPSQSHCEHEGESDDDDDDNFNCDHSTQSIEPSHIPSKSVVGYPSMSKSGSPFLSISDDNGLTASFSRSINPSESQIPSQTVMPIVTYTRSSLSPSSTGTTVPSLSLSPSSTGTTAPTSSRSINYTGTESTVAPSRELSLTMSPPTTGTSTVSPSTSMAKSLVISDTLSSSKSKTRSISLQSMKSNSKLPSTTSIDNETPSLSSSLNSIPSVSISIGSSAIQSPDHSVYLSNKPISSVDYSNSEDPTASAKPFQSKKSKSSLSQRPSKIEKSRSHRPSSNRPDHHTSRRPQHTKKHSTTFNEHNYASVSAASTVEVPWAGLVRSIKQGLLNLNNWWYAQPEKRSLSPIEQQLNNLKDECDDLISNAPANMHTYYSHRLEDVKEEIDDSLKNSLSLTEEVVTKFKDDITFIKDEFKPGEPIVPITFNICTNGFSNGTNYALLAFTHSNLTLPMGQPMGYITR
jgi:hypothetical protein